MPRLVRVLGHYWLEIDLAREGAPTLQALAERLHLDGPRLLGDLVELGRNGPVLQALLPSIQQALAPALQREILAGWDARHPHLQGAASPYRNPARLADGPFDCCRAWLPRCVDYPLDLRGCSLQVPYTHQLGPRGIERAPVGASQSRLGGRPALEEALRAAVAQHLATLKPAGCIASYLRLRLPLSALELPAHGNLYAETTEQHMVFDPAAGPHLGKVGRVT